ncbi:mechanosensitive ion channel family protein [Chryseolinea sp. T2]|uniref:mechanosensitive ion channel family protein n=1 Tax=Chryseolinea sp. T2 TaxID=3129255 RepID=UPI003076AFFE
MYSLKDLLDREYFNNTVQEYFIAATTFLVGLLLLLIFKRIILRSIARLVAKSESTVDDIVFSEVRRFITPIAGTAIIYWSVNTLALSTKVEKLVTVTTSVIIAFFFIRLISSAIRIALTSYVSRQDNGSTKIKQIGGVMIIINIVIWILGTIFLFDNLGYDVSTVLTGVGIGGIAVALAAQNIIGDLFNYFVIFFDKPFEVGDAINVDDKNGTIEHIGLKTTRLRSLSGEQIVIANSDLTKSRVHNFKRQENRRIEYSFSILYRTPVDKLKKIPGIIKEIIEKTPNTRFDRAHVARFSEYGLTVTVVYFITVPDYLTYMNAQEAINLQILEAFQREGINFQIREDKEFALPDPNATSGGTPGSVR